MGGGNISCGSFGKIYPGKLTSKVIHSCIVAASGGLIFGYNVGISGGVTSMVPFLEKFFFQQVYSRKEISVKSSDVIPFRKLDHNQIIIPIFSALWLFSALFSYMIASLRGFGKRKKTTMFGGFSSQFSTMGGGNISSGSKKIFTVKVILHTCIVAASGGLILAYNVGISGGVASMAPFLKKFFPEVYRINSHDPYCKVDIQILTLFTSSLYLAAFLSSMIASWITRGIGRRKTMIFGGLLSVIGAILNGIASNIHMLIIGRVLLGFAIGFANQAIPIYLSEIAPSKYRRAMHFMFQLSITIGVIVANLSIYLTSEIEAGWGWRVSLGGAIVPGLIFFFGCCFSLPESPISSLEHNRFKLAKAQLREIRGIDNVDEELNDLAKASHAAKLVENPWKEIFSKKCRPQLTYAILIPLLQQLSILNVFLFYAPLMGLSHDTSLNSSLMVSICNFFVTIIFMAIIDTNSRGRPLSRSGIEQMLRDHLVIMILAMTRKSVMSGNPGEEVPLWFTVVMEVGICINISGLVYSWGLPLGCLVPREIWPLGIRSATQSTTVGVTMMFTFCIAQIFTVMLCYLKFGVAFIFFAICVVGMSCFMFECLPEINGDLVDVWRSNHPYWTEFVTEEDDSIFEVRKKMHEV